MARRCIFCGKTPVSNEHIYPEWLRSLLIYDPRGLPKSSLEQVSHRRIKQRQQSRRWMSDKPFNHTIKSVCKTCNETWMSDIENSAIQYLSPMIRMRETSFDAEAQNIISRWIALRVMVFLSTTNHKIQIFQQWFEQFYRNKTIPPTWNIWIGAYVGILPAYYESHGFTYFPSFESNKLPTIIRRPGILINSTIGSLIYKVIGFTEQVGLSHNSFGNSIVRIFPSPSSQIAWPIGKIINDETILDFYQMGLMRRSALAGHWHEFQELKEKYFETDN